jgi:hypothetical protein
VGGDPFDFGPHPGGSGWSPPGGPQYGPPAGAPPTAPVPGPPGPWQPTPGGSGFDPPDLSATTVGKPPIVWLVAALVVGLAGAVVAFFGANPLIAIAAWALAGPGAIGLLAIFAQRDIGQRALPVYISSPGQTMALYWAAILVAAVGIAVSAWYIAQWAGRL